MNALSSRLFSFRKEAGLTQQQLATMLEVSLVTLNRWERGHTQPDGVQARVVEVLLGTSQRLGAVETARMLGAAGELGPLLFVVAAVAAAMDPACPPLIVTAPSRSMGMASFADALAEIVSSAA